jgi:hypothetical protein
MFSAFRRGVEILNDRESDSVQSQGNPMGNPGKPEPESMEGIGVVPKNLTQLKSNIDKLMQKVIAIAIRPVSANATQDLPKGIDEEWLDTAKLYGRYLKKRVSKEKEFLKGLLAQIESLYDDSEVEGSKSETEKN